MKNSFSIFNGRCGIYILSIIAVILTPFSSFSQTSFFNGGTDVTLYSNAILYVDGHLVNNIGAIHNQGEMYITGDWTNNEASGCLDATTGTVILNGASQTIQGTETTTFNNLDLQGPGTKTLAVNTVVGGNTGVLSLNFNPLDLNSNTCIVTNSAASAITRTSGYIISETNAISGYGRVQWNTGNTDDNYVYPFGTTTGNYIPFLYSIAAAGTQTTTGNVSVATYPTSVTASPNNQPLPAGVADLNDATGNESAEICADRFWDITVNNYSLNPVADITFTYRDIEWNSIGGSTNNIMEDSLLAWMWNGTQWQNPTLGTNNSVGNTVTVTNINYSAPWTLKSMGTVTSACGDFTVPNAFSPNNDGRNDLFILPEWSKCISSFSLFIFDRWGEKVFESKDPAKVWDGNYKGKTLDPAVFVYYIDAKLNNGEKIFKKGNISLIR